MDIVGDLERAFASIYPNRVAIAIATLVGVVALAIVAWRRGWFGAARRHPGRAIVAAAVVAAVAGPLGWYLASPLVISARVDEPAPVASERPAGALTGAFTGADEFHFGRGTARLVETSPGLYVVRLEEFAVRNGPDLYVYLSPSPEGYTEGAVELGRLKADTGNQNYEVPAGTDPMTARSVVIWCRAFSVEFATAPLAAT